MRKDLLFLLGGAAVGIACSSSDEGVAPSGDAGTDARQSNSGGSAGTMQGSGGRSGGSGGRTSTGGGAGAGAAGRSGRGGSSGADASPGTGGSQTAGGASGRDAGPSSGGAGGNDAAVGSGGASGSDAATGSGGADAASTPDAATGSIAALCGAVIAADCAKGPPSLGDCITLFESLSSCSVVRACVACAGPSPTVGCSSDGGPDVVGCESSCNIDACHEGGVGNHDSGPQTSCSGSDLVVKASGGPSPLTIPYTGNPIALFGPLEQGGRHGELGGQFVVTGLSPGEQVHVELIVFPCFHGGCPSDLSFGFTQPDAGVSILGSNDAGCGGGQVLADSSGSLTFSAGKTGSGPAEYDLGVLLTP